MGHRGSKTFLDDLLTKQFAKAATQLGYHFLVCKVGREKGHDLVQASHDILRSGRGLLHPLELYFQMTGTVLFDHMDPVGVMHHQWHQDEVHQSATELGQPVGQHTGVFHGLDELLDSFSFGKPTDGCQKVNLV